MRVYENPERTSENRLPPRSYYIPGGISEYYLLNGAWDFAYFRRDIDVPEEITQWASIRVPGCWQTQGYDQVNYTNTNYPYPVDLPYVPDDNPCGVYRRSFELAAVWGKVYLVLEGVASCAFLEVNGKYVGFTQGSHLQAEFDITDYVRPGTNTMRIKVLKWCCGSYLEDQDFFRHTGIFRDCYILQRPFGHIGDVDMIPDYDSIRIRIDGQAQVQISAGEKVLCRSEMDGEFSFTPADPIRWNAEKPFLYDVQLERGGEVLQFRTGLRKIEISQQYELLINGVSVKLHGINHHDTHPRNGWYQTNEELLADLKLMKQLNINCVRMSHYPPTPYFARMCDELGFYVIMETDLETHGILRRLPDVDYCFDMESGAWPATKPEWRKEYLERMERMVENYKNLPSIIMWSTGNESGHGENHVAMIDWTHSRDGSRLLHCEDANRRDKYSHVADVHSGMYYSYENLEKWAQDESIRQPIFLCEYAHAMGNGPGDVWDYNELFDRYPKLIGGCIWEWADHTVVDEKGVQRYGGDFPGEITDSGNFCCDGLVFSDRNLKAGSLEVKAVYQPVKTAYENGVLTITNRYDFTDLSECRFSYEIQADGRTVEEKTLPLQLKPHERLCVPVAYSPMECTLGVYLNCSLKKDGREVARTQHQLPAVLRRAVDCATQKQKEAFSIQEDGRNITVSGKSFCYTFSKHCGAFTSIVVDGMEHLSTPMRLSAFRAATDNDSKMLSKWAKTNEWEGENLDCTFTKTYACTLEGNVIRVSSSLAGVSRSPAIRYVQTITFSQTGEAAVALEAAVREDAVWLPRLGYEFAMPGENQKFAYYGMGPWENYCDMHRHARVGYYESSAEEEYVPYVRPQEHGNHTAVQKLWIGNLEFSAEDRMECNVSCFSTQALHRAQHTDELETDGCTHVRLDYRVSGMGSAACGPALREQYRLSEKKIRFAFRFAPKA